MGGKDDHQSQQKIVEMAEEMEMSQRDPNDLNSHVKVEFNDVLAEPEGAHSIDCVWRNSYTCFTCGKNCCYKFMTTLCGIFMALFWGCEFACITFNQVWCVTPMLRVFSIIMGCLQKYFGTCIMCCLAPVCETAGLCFSRITVTNASS